MKGDSQKEGSRTTAPGKETRGARRVGREDSV